MTTRNRTACYPDRETARWCTQQVVTRNEQDIHRWLAQGTRRRLVLEASWPSRGRPVGRVTLRSAGASSTAPEVAVDAYAARVVLRRDPDRSVGFAVHATFPVHL